MVTIAMGILLAVFILWVLSEFGGIILPFVLGAGAVLAIAGLITLGLLLSHADVSGGQFLWFILLSIVAAIAAGIYAVKKTL